MVPAPRWREVARFELSLQRREFLTWIYVAVFFFLCFGYASSGAVELVNGRGATWKNAPWAIAHAMAGVTAFGQVITTMITATAVMRDVASRTQELLFTTRLTRGAYLGGRYAGALATMLIVYLAIPVGLLAGIAMPWVDRSALAPFAVSTYARPLLVLVLPNVLVVSTLFFAAGALRRGFMAILLLGLSLVACWQTGLSLVHTGATVAGALVDPFGNAALDALTARWSADERNTMQLPVDVLLLANRLTWAAVAALVAWYLVRHFRFELVTPSGDRAASERSDAPRRASPALPSSTVAPGPPGWWRAARAEGRWIFAWTLRERGFVTLAVLGALNATVNAWGASASAPTPAAILATIQSQARVLLILIATIYAGELVWRDLDVRAHELRDSLPVATGALVGGRLAGILCAELVVVAPLALCALLVGWGRGGGDAVDLWLTTRWIFGLVFPFLAQLTLLSFLIHVLVQDKVAGHVLLIAGWVLAVAVERTTTLPAWLRFAEPPAFERSAVGFDGTAPALLWSEMYYFALAMLFALLATLFWVRGIPTGWRDRLRLAAHRLTLPVALALCATSLAAVGAAARLVAIR